VEKEQQNLVTMKVKKMTKKIVQNWVRKPITKLIIKGGAKADKEGRKISGKKEVQNSVKKPFENQGKSEVQNQVRKLVKGLGKD
jgi:hypothetical protein